MFVMKANERLYLRAWEYNAARILSELANIVRNNGGKVKPTKNAIVSDRDNEGQSKNEPIVVTHTGHISFVQDGTHYYYQVDVNPFSPFYYHKTPVRNGKYSLDSVLDEDKKEWLFNCYLKSNCSDENIQEGANRIYTMLINAENTPIRRDKERRRVPNTYNDYYHEEDVYKPERHAKVDY